jgi:hypothetical protein
MIAPGERGTWSRVDRFRRGKRIGDRDAATMPPAER